jgi:hypothetical protein
VAALVAADAVGGILDDARVIAGRRAFFVADTLSFYHKKRIHRYAPQIGCVTGAWH